MQATPCINLGVGEKIKHVELSYLPENLNVLCVRPAARAELRLHWRSCPYCREQFPYALDLIGVVDRAIKDRVAFVLFQWTEWWNSERANIDMDNADSCANILAALAMCGIEVQGALSLVLEDLTDFTSETDPTNAASQRVPVSKCADFIMSLEPGVRRFVFEAISCQESVMPPMQAQFGPPQMTFPVTDEEIAEHSEIQQQFWDNIYPSAREKLGRIFAEAFPCAPDVLQGVLRKAEHDLITFSETYSDLPSGGRAPHLPVAGLDYPSRSDIERMQKEQIDNFESLKAGQMEIIRLIERNDRTSVSFEAEIRAKLGTLYGRLGEATKRQLQDAEYLYSINMAGPDLMHGPVSMLAFAYESELLTRVFRPYLETRLAAGDRYYDGGGVPQRAMLREGKMWEKNLTLGNFKWFLENDGQLRTWVRQSTSFNLNQIENDLREIVPKRDDAAHKPVFKRSTADALRDWIFSINGPFARLHP